MKAKRRSILKNIDKFTNIKLAKGLNLKDVPIMYRKESKKEECSSLKKFAHLWFRLKKGNALFKTYDSSYKPHMKNIRMINEMVCNKLANQIGLNCAQYEPAYFDDDYGLVTYNFLKPKQKLFTLANYLIPAQDSDFTMVDIINTIDIYKMLGWEINKEQMVQDIYKIIVFDTLTMQSDRHSENVNFIKDENNYSISVAPLFDNEFAFNGQDLYELATAKKDANIKDLYLSHSKRSIMLDITSELVGNPKRYAHNVESVCSLAKSNKDLNKILAESLKKINIAQAIQQVEESGVQISDEYKQYLKYVIGKTTGLLKAYMKKPTTEDDYYLYEEHIK